MSAAARDLIERQKERLEFIQRDTRQYEEKIADILTKIDKLEQELFSQTNHGRQIPALVRENIGISVEVQFLEYEQDMRSSMNISNSRPPIRPDPAQSVWLDTSAEYPYARVIPQPHLPAHPSQFGRPVSHQPPPYPMAGSQPNLHTISTSSGNSPIQPYGGGQHYLAPPGAGSPQFSGHSPTPSRSPMTPTTALFQTNPNTMVNTNGQIFNVTPRGSLSQVVMQPPSGHSSPVPVPERPNVLPLPPRPTRPAPPPPTFQLPPQSDQPNCEEGGTWTCQSCSYDNHSAMPYCEICNTGRTAPRIGNIYTTFSSLYPKETQQPASSSSTATGLTVPGSQAGSPKSPLLPPPPLPAYSPVSPSSSLGSPPSSRRHKSRPHLVSFGKKRHSRHKDKRGDR